MEFDYLCHLVHNHLTEHLYSLIVSMTCLEEFYTTKNIAQVNVFQCLMALYALFFFDRPDG